MSTTRRRRPALILLATAAAVGCLALAWWQWTRYESTSGSFQNLGYAMQWPLFAGFCFYAYFKFVRYEEAPPELHPQDAVTEIPAGLLPERPGSGTPNRTGNRAGTHPDGADPDETDPALREYNAYLAELARTDADRDPADKRTR
ncbi:hypothetical protein [Mycolicibacterium gilvum]|uniref:hypothetical protein n=1 Tax=Mycolicibacterium gilvum TaxID=1804 RepID=UPI00404669B6